SLPAHTGVVAVQEAGELEVSAQEQIRAEAEDLVEEGGGELSVVGSRRDLNGLKERPEQPFMTLALQTLPVDPSYPRSASRNKGGRLGSAPCLGGRRRISPGRARPSPERPPDTAPPCRPSPPKRTGRPVPAARE